jgi:hypothetical protein
MWLNVSLDMFVQVQFSLLQVFEFSAVLRKGEPGTIGFPAAFLHSEHVFIVIA